MQFLSNAAADGRRLPTDQAGYEWWYFDVFDDRTETSLVVIFYAGNPFSRRMFERRTGMFKGMAGEFPAISVSLHKKGAPVFLGFREFEAADATFSGTQFQIGPNLLVQEEGYWMMQLDFQLPGGLTLRGKMRFDRTRDGWFGEGTAADAHGWNLAAVRAPASGLLVVLQNDLVRDRIEVRGEGYHDHNWGVRPLHRDYQSWSWGRFHMEGASVAFYYKTLASGIQEGHGWVFRDDRPTAEPIRIHPLEPRRSLFGLKSPRVFQLEGAGFRATLRHERVLETGPFYQRFISGAHFVLDGRSGYTQGISEFIQARAMHQRRWRMLAEMRIAYPGRRPHWVQRIPALFRLTWL